MKFRIPYFLSISALILAFSGPFSAHAGVIISHNGSTDPTTEGWLAGGDLNGVVVGPINDAGTAAWKVDDNSTVSGSTFGYTATPTAQNNADAGTFGWSFRMDLRIVDIPDGLDASIFGEYANGLLGYGIAFGAEADGDPIVGLFDNTAPNNMVSSFVLADAGSTYHSFELRYDPVAASADLFVDGVERLSDYAGFSRPLNRIVWGGFQSSTTGHGNYSLVQFSIIPEPSVLLGFLTASSLGLLFVRRRR